MFLYVAVHVRKPSANETSALPPLSSDIMKVVPLTAVAITGVRVRSGSVSRGIALSALLVMLRVSLSSSFSDLVEAQIGSPITHNSSSHSSPPPPLILLLLLLHLLVIYLLRFSLTFTSPAHFFRRVRLKMAVPLKVPSKAKMEETPTR